MTRSCTWLLALGIAAAAWGASAQPDPHKVLRVSFPIAETGFDPQASGDAPRVRLAGIASIESVSLLGL